ncbi:hypothetical protein BDR05DRAFT_1003687 [Suillus weaverae]|nr:hypothetical protein BDR05DRAFT_1003687 [Suillus weaverae]
MTRIGSSRQGAGMGRKFGDAGDVAFSSILHVHELTQCTPSSRFSTSQRRAFGILADVSKSIRSVLLPPAPVGTLPHQYYAASTDIGTILFSIRIIPAYVLTQHDIRTHTHPASSITPLSDTNSLLTCSTYLPDRTPASCIGNAHNGAQAYVSAGNAPSLLVSAERVKLRGGDSSSLLVSNCSGTLAVLSNAEQRTGYPHRAN